MKIPRWLMIAMLTVSAACALAVVIGAAWWWITWPERTARQYLALVQDARLDEAARMCSPMPQVLRLSESDEAIDTFRAAWRDFGVEPTQSRSFADLLIARQCFELRAEDRRSDRFTVVRGTVRLGQPPE